jgi:hypothetical protein
MKKERVFNPLIEEAQGYVKTLRVNKYSLKDMTLKESLNFHKIRYVLVNNRTISMIQLKYLRKLHAKYVQKEKALKSVELLKNTLF